MRDKIVDLPKRHYLLNNSRHWILGSQILSSYLCDFLDGITKIIDAQPLVDKVNVNFQKSFYKRFHTFLVIVCCVLS